MSQVVNSVRGEVITGQTDAALRRVFRVMLVSVIAAAIVSALLAPWRVTLGVVLGGGLSLVNFHWLRSSVGAIFRVDYATRRPRVQISSYVLRYFLVGLVVFGANELGIVSLPATIAALCSFVPALFVEAFREFYFAIIHREDSY